eukprot:366006-Chlamydomonas_euryale.AAC.10
MAARAVSLHDGCPTAASAVSLPNGRPWWVVPARHAACAARLGALVVTSCGDRRCWRLHAHAREIGARATQRDSGTCQLLEVAHHPHMPERGEMRRPNPGEAVVGSNTSRPGPCFGWLRRWQLTMYLLLSNRSR